MSAHLNRRTFLQSLIAMGAGFTLAGDATAAQLDQAWGQAQANPWFFDVDQWGTITDPDCTENETWDEIFCVSTSGLRTPDDLINEVVACQPLISHFQDLANEEVSTLQTELDDEPAPNAQRRRHILRVIEAIEGDPDDGWQTWIDLEGKAGVSRFKNEIDEWLSEPADYSQSEWFPLDHGSQGQAKRFFELLDDATAQALGVVIIEGEHPGSSYYAAELRQGVEPANEVAQALGLPFRFRGDRGWGTNARPDQLPATS